MKVMGTDAVILVSEPDRVAPDAVTDATDAALEVIEQIEAACSRFRPESDLSRVNESAGRPVAVGTCFLDALAVALDAARRTDGVVDPTIGGALRALGYDRDFASLDRDGAPVLHLVRVTGWRCVEIDPLRSTVRVPPGTRLDLGATAKALAADRAAAAAAATVGCGVLVSIGGDLAVAGEPPEGGWPVRITDWQGAAPDAPGQTVRIGDGGLATSSVTVRHWKRGGIDHHHLVDPATGRSADVVWRTISVAAGNCVDANVASTAAVIMGRGATDWLGRTGLPARLTDVDGTVTTLGGWEAEAA
jgi:thiamine biosynthesis lipoprotein